MYLMMVVNEEFNRTSPKVEYDQIMDGHVIFITTVFTHDFMELSINYSLVFVLHICEGNHLNMLHFLQLLILKIVPCVVRMVKNGSTAKFHIHCGATVGAYYEQIHMQCVK